MDIQVPIIRKGDFNHALVYHRRVQLGLTLTKTCQRIKDITGHSRSSSWLSDIEHGRNTPNPESLYLLAQAFGVTTEYFFAPKVE